MRVASSLTAAIQSAAPSSAGGIAASAKEATDSKGGNSGVRTSTPVAATRTKTSMNEMRGALSRAYQTLHGKPPTAPMLDTLTAQAALETGRGEQMFNYNFGGIKGRSPTGETARYGTCEVVDGKSIHITDGFRAYRSLDDGARDFVALLSTRYAGALGRAETGDMKGYAEALHQKGYFTAPASEYASGLTRLVGELGGKVNDSGARLPLPASPFGGGSIDALPTTLDVRSFMDVLSMPVAQIAAPADEEERDG